MFIAENLSVLLLPSFSPLMMAVVPCGCCMLWQGCEMIGNFLRSHLCHDQAVLVAGRAVSYALTKLWLVNTEEMEVVSGWSVSMPIYSPVTRHTCIQDMHEDIMSATRTALVCLSFLQSKGETS